MHPILASARRRNLYLASWTVIGLLVAVAWSAANPDAGIAVALAVAVPPCLVQAFVCLSAWYVCRAAPADAGALVRTLAMHAGAGMVAATVWAVAWAAWTGVLAGLPAFGDAARVPPAQLAAVAAAGVLLFWLSSLLHYLLAAFEQSRRAEARELGLEVLAREAELKALRAQIDPHFLFNGLQSISALASADPAGARRMCLLLADFFRSSVRLGAEEEIRLDEEMAMVRAYLDIERVRYGPRLESEVVLPPGCGSCRVPPLILQPLVENAVRHGIRPLVDGGVVQVTARCDEAALQASVRQPAVATPEDARPRKVARKAGTRSPAAPSEGIGERSDEPQQPALPCVRHSAGILVRLRGRPHRARVRTGFRLPIRGEPQLLQTHRRGACHDRRPGDPPGRHGSVAGLGR